MTYKKLLYIVNKNAGQCSDSGNGEEGWGFSPQETLESIFTNIWCWILLTTQHDPSFAWIMSLCRPHLVNSDSFPISVEMSSFGKMKLIPGILVAGSPKDLHTLSSKVSLKGRFFPLWLLKSIFISESTWQSKGGTVLLLSYKQWHQNYHCSCDQKQLQLFLASLVKLQRAWEKPNSTVIPNCQIMFLEILLS